MTEQHKIFNIIILDESGSMESIKKPTISGFNELVQTIHGGQKNFLEQKHYVSFITFNGFGIKTPLFNVSVDNLQAITEDVYRPDSMTPLYDAIGETILKMDGALEMEKNNPYNVLVTILTDGEENASKTFSGASVAAMIEERRKRGWVFTYIGANQDVEKVAKTLNIDVSNVLSYQSTEGGTKDMFQKEAVARSKFYGKLSKKEKADDKYFDDEKA